MSKAPSMPMYWDAYLADTTHLTTEEHGAYMLLLAAMWRRNGAVPDDDKDNARILGLTPAKWRKVKARLAATISGFRIESGLITQEKLQKTWENTQEKIDKNRANGAKGGRAAARDNKDLAQANATNSQERKASIPEPEPEPVKKKEASASLQKKPQRAVSIPDNWVPSDANIDYALSKQLTQEEIQHEADRFRDHHLAKGTTFKNWDAGWRTWIGNAIKYNRGRGMAQANGKADARDQQSVIAAGFARSPSGDCF